jgi:hypothetical protein
MGFRDLSEDILELLERFYYILFSRLDALISIILGVAKDALKLLLLLIDARTDPLIASKTEAACYSHLKANWSLYLLLNRLI